MAKFIEASYQIHRITPCEGIDALKEIEWFAKTSTGMEETLSKDSAQWVREKILNPKRPHHTMALEAIDMVVVFITNRGVTHELVTHRLVSRIQESTRRGLGKATELTYIVPADMTNMDMVEWMAMMRQNEKDYFKGRKLKWSLDQQRCNLNNSLKARIVMKANCTEWRHIFKLRWPDDVHYDMRFLMRPLLAEAKTRIPVVFDDIYPQEKE
jgi:thymidylate synthase (FAD)